MIQLDNDFYIEEDVCSWVLIQKISPAKDKDGNKKLDENGEPAWNTDRSYHPTVGMALSWYLNQCLRGSKDLQDVLARLTEAEARIEKITL